MQSCHRCLIVVAHRILTKCNGIEPSHGIGEEAKSILVVVEPYLEVVVTRGRRSIIKVIVEVAGEARKHASYRGTSI
jgi:hypothetical protein